MASNAKNLAELLNNESTIAVADVADGSITTAKLADDAVTNAKIGASAVGTTEIADDAVTSTKSDGSIGVGKNVIINGAMSLAQRGTSSTGIGASHGYFTCDRWYIYSSNNDGRLTMSQDTDAPEGFSKSLKLACTTADTSISSNESLQLVQKIEAQNMQHFCKGTSSAKAFALSFYVKGNAAATYVAELEDYDNSSRHVGKAFNVTTSWNRVSIIFPADTTGVLGEDNAVGIALNIHLHSGSFNTSGTLRETWGTLSQGDRVGCGKTSFFDSTNRTFFITGVKLEPVQVTDFEHPSFAEELTLCQRYYLRKNASSDAYTTFAQGYIYNSTNGHFRTEFPTTMRATPSFGKSGTFRLIAPNADNLTSFLLNHASLDGASFDCGVSGGHGESNGNGGLITASNDANAYVRFDAEL